jgi:acetoin utilization deacetylase AcuC-like enzyme
VKKVCIFDWDVHCGDGTSKIFYEDETVLYISIHRYDDGGFYPAKRGSPKYLGRGKGFGYNI